MSMIKIDEKIIPLESLTKEEKAAAWEIMAKRIGGSITDYVNRHPEHYDCVAAALKSAQKHPWQVGDSS